MVLPWITISPDRYTGTSTLRINSMPIQMSSISTFGAAWRHLKFIDFKKNKSLQVQQSTPNLVTIEYI